MNPDNATNLRFNIMAPDFRANPYPYYAEMRRSSPVCVVDPGGAWAVSRYADVEFIFKHPELFSSQGFRAAWEPAWVGYNPVARSILAMDGPAHARLRTLVSRAFGPRSIARLEPRIAALAGQLAGDLASAGEADFIKAFADPLPVSVIGELLGVDKSLWPRLRRWADDVAGIMPTPASPEHAARTRQGIAELTECVTEILAARRRAPADDLISDLIRAEVDGQSLRDEEIVAFVSVLLLGGFDTTTNLLANSVRLWVERPEEAARLRADHSLIAGFVEEMLRFDPPVHAVPRVATANVEVSGVTIPEGALVLPLIGSANRDEKRFERPDVFDITRGQPGSPLVTGSTSA